MTRYRAAIIVGVIFLVLLVVVLLTAPSSVNAPASNPNPAASPTVSADAQKLRIIGIAPPDSLQRIEISTSEPAKTVSFVYSTTWKLAGNEAATLDQTQLGQLALRLSQLGGSFVVSERAEDAAKLGFDKPKLKAVITSQNQTQTLLVGNPVAATGEYNVKLDNNPRIWTLDPDIPTLLQTYLANPPIQPTATAAPSSSTTPNPPITPTK